MTQQQIETLANEGIFPDGSICEELIETHASWVILTEKFAFKIKKPVKFSFLDFSTLALRQHACEEEVRLNRRLTDIYLGTVPIVFGGKNCGIGIPGETVDFAVQMQRVDHQRQMDLLLEKDLVKDSDIEAIAEQLAVFHQNARVMNEPFDEAAAMEDFADLASVSKVLTENVDEDFEAWIDGWIELAGAVLQKLAWRFEERVQEDFVRDGHGDLHSRNIFLLEKPVIFDCIEFNERFRVNDVLSELAFLAMDLKRFGRKDFKGILIKKYSETYPCFRLPEDRVIFQYFLLYRATVRLKVAGLQLGEELAEPTADIEALKAEVRTLANLCRNYAWKLKAMSEI